ncbi:IS481 family transposase domain protein [Rickettsiales endosymbiont of Paramecium tredecaurelia]|nr:IS481 family transposase domain protein [Candidatus Sarmatiella mevalonica]
MGQILHANARTTEAIRREIRDSKESIEKAAKGFNVNPKTAIFCYIEYSIS